MGKETYQITEYVHDQVIAHCTAFGIIGTTEPKEDINHLIDFNELESSNPPDTIQVATFFLEKTSTKKIYYYVCSFPEEPFKANHQEGYLLFSIMWLDSDNYWTRVPWHSCSVSSEQPLPPLHKEAANWMLKRITTKGCWNAEADFFKMGKLEILI